MIINIVDIIVCARLVLNHALDVATPREAPDIYCVVLYCIISSRLVSSCLVLCRLVLSCLVLHCFILPSSSSLTSVATTITIIINIILSLIAVTTITSLRHHQVTIIGEFFVIVIHINII